MTTEAIEAATARIETLAPGGKPVPIRTPLEEDECHWFLRAVEHGIVEFTTCPDDCFRFKKWSARGPDHFVTPSGKPRHLFSTPSAPEAWLNREYVPHIAAYARAVLDLGYNANQSSFSRYRKFSRDLITKKVGGTYETDAEFYDTDGVITLQIEAKADRRGTEKLAAQMAVTKSLGALPLNAAKEIEYVLDLAPRWLWVVGPGSVDPATHLFAVTIDDLDARFEPTTTEQVRRTGRRESLE